MRMSSVMEGLSYSWGHFDDLLSVLVRFSMGSFESITNFSDMHVTWTIPVTGMTSARIIKKLLVYVAFRSHSVRLGHPKPAAASYSDG
jgi:hypothetical protein